MKRFGLVAVIAVLAFFQVAAFLAISRMDMRSGLMQPCPVSVLFGGQCMGDMNAVSMLSHHISAVLSAIPTAVHGDAAVEAFIALLALLVFTEVQRRSFVFLPDLRTEDPRGRSRRREAWFFAYRRKRRWSVQRSEDDDAFAFSRVRMT